jgi:hypothetical protein
MRLLHVAAISAGLIACTNCYASDLKSEQVYSAWLKMYDLKFDQAHEILKRWRQTHPQDPLGPASDAGGYLFSELARLGVLESQLFVDDEQFKNRRTFDPDPSIKTLFDQCISEADRLADVALQQSSDDVRALFAKTITNGLRADYIALIDGHGVRALSYTKAGRVYAERLMHADPEAFDAYLAPGIENYLLSLKPIAFRVLLRLSGSQVDREKGLQNLRSTALHGYYLEPFAKLLLAVAALRDNQKDKAREILSELHNRFPDNHLYSVELNRLSAPAQ